MADAAPPDPQRYPRGAFFILGGYLLERFVYYGLFGGSVFYMQRVLGFSAPTATSIKSILEGLIYLAPVVGAIIADSFLGKFRLVFYMCLGYVLGTLVFALSAVPMYPGLTGQQAMGIGGLLLFGLCAGTMKAVYSSMGPDQFLMPEQRDLQKRFFYCFYWMINGGAFLGQLMTAQLRDSVQCFGADCFLLPYGLFTVFMALSTATFFAGKHFYRESPPDPMIIRAGKCVFRAAKLRFRASSKEKPVEHWLDRAAFPGSGQVTDPQLIADVKQSLGVLLLFTTFPIFWALFYQTSTGMIFQAKRLNDRVGASYRIPPELTSAINPLLILILIPLFDLLMYPLLARCGLLTRTSSRMTVGMLFAVVSFFIYGLLNMQLEQSLLGPGQAGLQVYNDRPCAATLRPYPDQDTLWTLPAGGQVTKELSDEDVARFALSLPTSCDDVTAQQVTVPLAGGLRSTLVLGADGARALAPSDGYIKDTDADATVRLVTLDVDEEQQFRLSYRDMDVELSVVNGSSIFKTLAPQYYKVINVKEDKHVGDVDIRQDGVYDVIISADHSLSTFAVTAPSDIHVLWTIPQYLFMTIGEVLFSVSGMDFAYTEAPKAMKSVMQAAYLLTITVGLWLLALMTSVSSSTGMFLHQPSREAFTYAVLMFLDTAVFFLLMRRYLSRAHRHQADAPLQPLETKAAANGVGDSGVIIKNSFVEEKS